MEVPTAPRQALVAATVVAVVALAVRAVVLTQVRDAPAFDLVIGDGKYFLEWSREILRGDWVGAERSYHQPLYAVLLAGIQAIAGKSLFAIKAAQIAIGALSCGVLAFGASRLAGASCGLVAGLLLALYPPAIFGDSILQKSVLDVFLTAVLFAGLAELTFSSTFGRAALVGATLGLLALVRENTVVWVPVIGAWLLFRCGLAQGVRVGAVLGLAFAAVLFPAALRNLAVSGEFRPTTSNFGVNLYLGNRAGASGVYEPLVAGRGNADVEWQDAVALAEAAEDRRLDASEVSGHWARRGLADIASDPVAWTRLMLRKTILYTSAVERMDTEDQYTLEEASPLLRGLGSGFDFGVLLALAGFGAVVSWRRAPEQRLVWTLVGVYSLTVLAFSVMGRYRLPAGVLLTFPAALGLVTIPALLRARAFPVLGAGVVAGLVLTLLAFLPARSEPLLDPRRMRASTALNVGLVAGQRGNVALSEQQLRLAVELHPTYALAHNALGQLLTFTGRTEEAEAAYRKAIAASEAYVPPKLGLAELQLRRGDLDGARVHLDAVRALEPGNDRLRALERRAERR